MLEVWECSILVESLQKQMFLLWRVKTDMARIMWYQPCLVLDSTKSIKISRKESQQSRVSSTASVHDWEGTELLASRREGNVRLKKVPWRRAEHRWEKANSLSWAEEQSNLKPIPVLALAAHIKIQTKQGCKDGSVVKSKGFSIRGPGIHPQHLHGS